MNARLDEYSDEMKACKDCIPSWTQTVWNTYNNDWKHYVKSGGDRPDRPPVNP